MYNTCFIVNWTGIDSTGIPVIAVLPALPAARHTRESMNVTFKLQSISAVNIQ